MNVSSVLVTGGAGFIGSQIVDEYVRQGWRVTVVDDMSSGSRENVNAAAELVEADIRDREVLRLLETRHFDLVNHHAAQIDVRKSVDDPAADAELNVVASIALFEKAATCGVKKVIFASSGGAIYGEPVHEPQREDHPFQPASPYGCAKLTGEIYLRYFAQVRGLPFVALRYGNVYGPRQSSRGEAGVIAIFADRMFRGEEIIINGSGEQTRDYVFVEDVVRANLAASTLDVTGAWNVGTGVETSVNRLYETLAHHVGFMGSMRHVAAKAGEQMRSVLDGSALRTLGGLPRPVEIDKGLARTVEWFRNPM